MKVEQIVIPKEEAEAEYRAYKQALLKHKDRYVKDLKSICGHMRHGRAIIDLWTSLKKAGLNKDWDPRLAICNADSKNVMFEKLTGGGGRYFRENPNTLRNRWDRWCSAGIRVPEGTFDYPEGMWRRRCVETIVPIIPAKFLNVLRGKLQNYHLLWEVEEWKPAPARDPILLKKLTPNIFVVLATWNLTKLERAVIRGRLA